MRKSVPRKRGFKKIEMAVANKAEQDSVYSRQPIEKDNFSQYYDLYSAIKPPYNFSNLYYIYERSDVLRWCINSMRLNIDGFGYSLKFVGEDRIENVDDAATGTDRIVKTDPEAVKQRKKLESFLNMVNESGQTFRTLRKKLREDYEVTGNAALEIARNRKGEIESIYHIPVKYLRKCARSQTPTFVNVNFTRDGETIKLERRRFFRRYVQKLPGVEVPVYYKEFGDTRLMNSVDGKYYEETAVKKLKAQSKKKADNSYKDATEILWFQQDMGDETYGIPRWIGSLSAALSRQNTGWINYNLTKKGGIPPFLVTVSGGTLTEESYNDLQDAIDGLQTDGIETWTSVLVLESTPETMGLEDKGTAKIEVKSLVESRQDDLMFGEHRKENLDDVRKCFRIAPLYTGGTEDFNRATSISAIKATEQQVFQPEREDFDEQINGLLFRDGLGISLWIYQSNGPRIVGDEEYRLGMETFAKYGALTLNETVDMANASFGLEQSKFKQKWGNYPFTFVIELLRAGKLGDLDELMDEEMLAAAQENQQDGQQQNFGGGLNPRPVVPPTIESKSDLEGVFSPDEIELWKKLKAMEQAFESVQVPHELSDHELSI